MALKRELNLTYTTLLFIAPKKEKTLKIALKLLESMTPMSIQVYMLYSLTKKKVENLLFTLE